MKRDKARDRKKASFEREFKIKKVHSQKDASKNWKRFLDSEDFDD